MKKCLYSFYFFMVLLVSPIESIANWNYYFGFEMYFYNYNDPSQQFFQNTIQLKLKNNHYIEGKNSTDVYGTGNYEQIYYGASKDHFQDNQYIILDDFKSWGHDTSSIIGINLTVNSFDEVELHHFYLNDTLFDLEELIIPSIHGISLDFNLTPKLKKLDVSGNEMFYSNLTNLQFIEYVSCNYNKFTLKDLFYFSEKISDPMNKLLGKQNPRLPGTLTAPFVGDTIDFSESHIINGIQTIYEIDHSYDSTPVVEGVDYTVNNGKLVFITAGDYDIKRTNSAITSHTSYPAYEEYSVIIQEELISWDWKVNQGDQKTVISNANGDDVNNHSFIHDKYYFFGWIENTNVPYSAYSTDGIMDTIKNTYYIDDTVTSRFVKRHRYPSLNYINLSNQGVTNINIISNIDSINLDGNQLSLSNLYEVKNQLNYPQNSILGIQTHEVQVVTLNESIDISEDLIVNQTPSTITVIKGGNPATEGVDYTINGGLIEFLTTGEYEVEITNSLFNTPGIGGGESPSIKFSFTATQLVSNLDIDEKIAISAYPNPTNGKLSIHSEHSNIVSVHVLDIVGKVVKEYNELSTNKLTVSLPEIEGIHIIKVLTSEHKTKVFQIVKT